MVGEVQTLVKVLNLEIKNNYQDKAVTGGFKNFRAFIEKLSQDSGLSPDVLEEIGDSFKKYEDLIT